MWSRSSFNLVRSSRSCAIISEVDPDGAASGVVVVVSAVGSGGGVAHPRPFLPTMRGAMIAFSTLAEPQIGQVTSLRFTCESYADELWNQLSNSCSWSQWSA